jgi:hypothetical protein
VAASEEAFPVARPAGAFAGAFPVEACLAARLGEASPAGASAARLEVVVDPSEASPLAEASCQQYLLA